MRTIVAAVTLLAFTCVAGRQAVGQAAPAPVPSTQTATAPSWSRVQALPAGVSIHVKANKNSSVCTLKSTDDSSLTCVKADTAAQTLVYQLADIKWVKIHHRGRSALLGATPGFALMAGGGIVLATENCKGQFLCGIGAAVFIALGAVVAIIGAIVGTATDFTNTTLYRRP